VEGRSRLLPKGTPPGRRAVCGGAAVRVHSRASCAASRELAEGVGISAAQAAAF